MKNAFCWVSVAAMLSLAPTSLVSMAHAGSSTATPELDRLSADIQTLSQRVSPAVVQVFSSFVTPASRGGGETASSLLTHQRASGSGVIVDPAGYVVTNAHVIEGAARIQVSLVRPREDSPGRSILQPSGRRYEATLVGSDVETDLAVLKIEGEKFPTLLFADSEELRQGQLVLALGSPLGLENSVSLGVISSAVRQLEPDSPMIYLQTDATINPGNSGGPLVDAQGAIVGINTFILNPPVGGGMGFAAPSNIVSAVYRQIREHGSVRRGEIGVRAQTITPELAKGLGLDRESGVVLADVFPNGPGSVAGLEVGDVVETLDGKAIENARQLDVNLYRRAAGDEVVLRIRREGAVQHVRVRLTERPTDDENRFASLARPEESLIEPLGILAVAVDERLARIIPVREPWGVLVALSTGDAPPGGAPLIPGDVIRTIGRTKVTTLDELRRGLAGQVRGAWVTLHVERGGAMIYVPCEMP